MGLMGVIRSAGNAVQAIVNTAKDEVSNVANQAVSEAKDYFNTDNLSLKGMGKGAWEGIKDVLSGKGGLGHVVDGALDGLGLPDWVGNFAGAAVNFMTMDPGGGAELALKGGAMLAGEAGNEKLENFLSVAGDVTGMATMVGKQVALSVVTGGAGSAGVFAQLGANAGQLGQAAQWVSKGVEIAGHVDKAINVAGAIKDGNILGVGSALFSAFGGNAGVLGDLMGNSEIGGLLGNLFGDGGGLLGNVLEQFGPELLNQLPLGDILGQLGLGSDSLSGLAGPIVEIGKELVGMIGQSVDLPGTALFASQAGQDLIGTLANILSAQVSGALGDLEVTAEAMIQTAAQTTAGMIDVAAHDAGVAMELMELLAQMSAMGGSALVSDLMGAHIHC